MFWGAAVLGGDLRFWEREARPFSFINDNPSVTNHINSSIVDGKVSLLLSIVIKYMLASIVASLLQYMLTFHSFTWEFSL